MNIELDSAKRTSDHRRHVSAYLLEIITRISPKGGAIDFEVQRGVIAELAVELDRLDPRDFATSAQAEFVILKAQLKAFHSLGRGNFPIVLRELKKVLQAYGGLSSHLTTRAFVYIDNPELRALIERDYRELSVGLLPSRSWKSAVILAGSILEAILYAVLMREPSSVQGANASSKAPRKNGAVIPLESGKWTLATLLSIATELTLVPPERAKTVDQVVRDYRNFVHPQKEIRAKHSCGEAEALLAKGALEGICNHFEKALAIHGAPPNARLS